MPTVSYRCSSCLDHTLTREFDVSHFSVKCGNCGEFARFVHQGVLDQYEAFEESPPDDLDWARLGRLEKLFVAEGLVRKGKTLDDFDVEVRDDGGDNTDEGKTDANENGNA